MPGVNQATLPVNAELNSGRVTVHSGLGQNLCQNHDTSAPIGTKDRLYNVRFPGLMQNREVGVIELDQLHSKASLAARSS